MLKNWLRAQEFVLLCTNFDFKGKCTYKLSHMLSSYLIVELLLFPGMLVASVVVMSLTYLKTLMLAELVLTYKKAYVRSVVIVTQVGYQKS